MLKYVSFFSFEVWLIYNIILVSAIQHSDSIFCIDYSPFKTIIKQWLYFPVLQQGYIICFLQFSKESPKREVNSIRASYSADGNGNVFILWGTCLRWDLCKLFRQGKAGSPSRRCHWILTKGVHFSQVPLCNLIFPRYQGPTLFLFRALVWMPESWWSWVFSFLVHVLPVLSKPEPDSYQYFQSLSLIYFPHTWTWKGSSVLLWGFLTFIECLELSWITQTLVFVLKDFKNLTKDSQFYRPYFHRPPNLPSTTSAS